jgi:hypothetical protein
LQIVFNTHQFTRNPIAQTVINNAVCLHECLKIIDLFSFPKYGDFFCIKQYNPDKQQQYVFSPNLWKNKSRLSTVNKAR